MPPNRKDIENSWTVTHEAIKSRSYDIKAMNLNAKKEEDLRTPEKLLDLIEAKGRKVGEALAGSRNIGPKKHLLDSGRHKSLPYDNIMF